MDIKEKVKILEGKGLDFFQIAGLINSTYEEVRRISEEINGMFNFSEKQGRLCISADLYLELDLDNKDLEIVYNELKIEIKHPLISDYEIHPIKE